ncbi:hypothetical protein ACVFI8_21505 [Agarivorans sp. MS3-6]
MRNLLYVLTLTVALFYPSLSAATLITDEVYLNCTQSSASDHQLCEGNGALAATVSDAVEYADYFNFQNSLNIDVLADAIRLDFENGPYCGWFTCNGQGFLSFVLSDLDWIGQPNNVLTHIDVTSNISGVKTSFTPDSVSFALPETEVTSSMFLQIDLFSESIPANTNARSIVNVSEPASVAVFSLAMLGLVTRRLNKSHSSKNN